jgi:N-acetylglutamate synthase-like GNAT family acetyltransferase
VYRATDLGFEKLCAFTHDPAYFVRRGFSIVPHVWLPEKIVTDCRSCPRFRHCGQYAVMRELGWRRPLHG